MKYWVFQSNQVNGPYEAVELAQLSGFTSDSLVCPEGRRGTSMGDWQRAGMVAELSAPLMKASQVAAAVASPAAASAAPSGLPPEPTLRDLAALGSLQEKVTALERTVAHLRDDLDRKETEILGLHATIDDKDRRGQELSAKLAGLDERLAGLTGIKENLDKAVAAEREMESSVKRQSQTIEELSREIEVLKTQKTPAKPAEDTFRPTAPPKEEPKLAPPALVIPPPIPEILTPPVPETPPPAEPVHKVIGSREDLTREMASMKAKKQKELEESTMRIPPAFPEPIQPLAPPPSLETPLPSSFQPLGGAVPEAAMPQAVPVPIEEAPAAAPKKKIPVTMLAAVGALAVAGVLFKAGVFGRRAAPKAPPAAPAAPAPDLAPKAPSPEEQAEQLKQLAVDIVKGWPGPDGAKTVGQMLEGGVPPAGKLSPWMAEKIKDDVYQVNFYTPKTSENAPTVAYEFQTQLGARQVVPMNDAAKALLAPPPPPPEIKAPKAETPQGGVSSRRPARSNKKKRRKPAKSVQVKPKSQPEPASLDQLLLPGVSPKADAPAETAKPAEEPAEAPAAPAAEAPADKPAKKAAADGKTPPDAQLLDDLLKP